MQPHSPLSDSPWFWLYLFATSALIGLALINPKFERRQAQIERQFQGRSRAEQVKAGQEPDVAMSSPGETRWNLRPFFLGLAALAGVGWIVLWRRHWRPAGPSSTAISRNAPPASPP